MPNPCHRFYAPYAMSSTTAAALLLVLLALTGCRLSLPVATPPAAEPEGVATPTTVPDEPAISPGPAMLTLWHHRPEAQAATLRRLLDAYQDSHPDVVVRIVYQHDLYGALWAAKDQGTLPDIILMPGDRLAENVAAGALAPLDFYVSDAWLADSFLPQAIDALRFDGKLWGFPVDIQTVTFIYNPELISPDTLSAQTAELLAKAEAYQAAHPGTWYLTYPARNDVYFAAPWFYGAGAWYAKEDGSIGLDTPAGLDAATWLASLRAVMPPEVGYGAADHLFKSGQAAITVNGPWYLDDLEAVGTPYALQIMPVVSSSGQPAQPLVTADGFMLGARPRRAEDAMRLIAYLTGPESELTLAREHGLVPANRRAIEGARDEGLAVAWHFAYQASLGVAMPTTPYMGATWGPVSHLLEMLWDGTAPEEALSVAQAEAEAAVEKHQAQGDRTRSLARIGRE